jgi:hypothetical protein
MDRLLTPSGLREMELEAISTANKMEANGYRVLKNYVENGLLQMKHPATAEQLDEFFLEQKYNFRAE